MKPELNPDLEGTCPCGKKWYVLLYGVMHELPLCEKFYTLDVIQYLRYIRQATTGITDN